MTVEAYTFKFEPITPLLMANWRKTLVPKASGPQVKTADLPLEEQAELSTYRTEDGYLAGPAQGLRSAIITAAKNYKALKGRGALAQHLQHIQIEPEELVILHDRAGVPLTEYEIDVRRVVNQNTGGSILVGRAKAADYVASITFYVDTSIFAVPNPFEQIKQLFTEAGLRVGWGAFRPEPPNGKTRKGSGWFGKWRVL